MKIAIVYKSITGNTAEVAEAVREGLAGNEIVYFGEPKEGIEAQMFFIGSWIDKGTCCPEILEFLKSMKNSQIAFFATAGSGSSESYNESLFNRIKEQIPASNQLAGHFICQGRMPQPVRSRYEQMLAQHPEDSRLQASIKNFDEALSHPDSRDLGNARQWAAQCVQQLENQ